MKSYWQVKDAAGRVVADYLAWELVTEILAAFQHRNIKVTLHQVDPAAEGSQ